MRAKQITCLCNRYDFPHRLGGGKCNGREWTESYFTTFHNLCQMCNCNNNGCEVASGSEELEHCEAYNHFLHSGINVSLPKDMDDELETLTERYYDN